MGEAQHQETIAVIGGGITGLVAARALANYAVPTTKVVLYEATDRLGGKIRTESFAGGTIEAGPDSFLAREPEAVDLCRELGLEDELISPEVFGAALWAGDELHRFPADTFFGLPATPAAALKARVLSPAGRARALGDLVVSGPLTAKDISVGDFVTRRFGAEVLERLVDPLLAGTRAGRTDEMSLAAALPHIDALARKHRSVMRALARERRTQPNLSGPPPFLGIRGGMKRLVDALVNEISPAIELATGTPIESIRRVHNGYELRLKGRDVHVDAVLITTPAFDAARLVGELSPRAAEQLRTIEYASLASVSLFYPDAQFSVPENTSGVLVSSKSHRTISGCTWWSMKWPEASRQGQVVRCFVGRSSEADPTTVADEELISRCSDEVSALVNSTARPRESSVTRWPLGLPQYSVGHLDRVRTIEQALSEHDRIAVAGAAYRGSGLPDCIKQAEKAALTLV